MGLSVESLRRQVTAMSQETINRRDRVERRLELSRTLLRASEAKTIKAG